MLEKCKIAIIYILNLYALNEQHTQQNKEHFEILLAMAEDLLKPLKEYKDYFITLKDENIHTSLTELYQKINASSEEFIKATSNATNKILEIIDSRWEQVRQNALELQTFYDQGIKNENTTRPMRKHFLHEHQKFFSMEQHAGVEQNALKDTKQIVDANFTHKTNITNIPTSENKSELQENAIAQPNDSQRSGKLSLISNTKKSQLQIIKR